MGRRFSLIAPLLLGLVLALAAPALAKSYGSKAHPIRAEDASDDGNAWFYGRMSVYNGQFLRNHYHYRDSKPGGNSAFVTTHYYFYRQCDGGVVEWCDTHHEDRSSETTSGKWIQANDYEPLKESADRGRMVSKVCENQAWAPDDCSRNVIGTFSY